MADAAKPKRRLPFKPTALRQKSDPKPAQKKGEDSEDEDGINLFRRAATFFPVAEKEAEEERRRRRAERERSSRAVSEVEERPSPSKNSEEPMKKRNHHEDDGARDFGSPPPSKRSRTSDDSPDAKVKPSPINRTSSETPTKRMTRAAASRTPRKQEPPQSKPIISIDDSDDDVDEDDIYDASPIRKPVQTTDREPSPLIINADEDDDPFAEPDESDPPAASAEDDELEEYYVRLAEERKKARQQEEAEAQTVTVYVTSAIPETTNRQFRFTLSKPLKVLRTAWIQVHSGRNGTRADLADVFLTWRAHRLYDGTTLQSLDLPGEYRKCGGDYGGFRDDEWTNVHMEMWTQQLWEEHERQVARQRRHDLGEFSEDEEGGVGGAGGGGADQDVAEAGPHEEKIKVLLKTKTDEPLKTSVRPSTTIGTMKELFRKMRGLAADAPLTLMFDGDELQEDATVEEADIGDMETVEVYLR
ncbi:hypothetical protein C8034_v010509 [Colletotrichum sidae]|uniref:Ubiquitin-like domain-containing protein n=1 Tax=Colletotrichum sidae TaxID=1347389 RepID=A0A4R8TKS6_9PEZI|nr:hypothetical protein C8034_v010509 [Colletotrichum sidae]